MDKRVFLILLLLFTSFCSSMPMVRARDPVNVYGEINRDDWCLYPKLRYYRFRVYVWDQDGADDIRKVYLSATDSEDAAIFELRADNLDSSPSYSVGTGADIIHLNESACYWVLDGEYGWAYFYAMVEWDCPLYLSCGIHLYVEDASGGWHQEQDRINYYDIVPRLTTDNFTSTGSTVENVGELITVEGYLRYAECPSYGDINNSSPFSPPASELNILHLHDSNHVSVADTTVIDSEGYFNMSFNLPVLAQENTYHVYIDMVNNYTDGDALDGDTIAIIGLAGTNPGWTPGTPSIPEPEAGDEKVYMPNKTANFGVILIVGTVVSALIWKEVGERKKSSVQGFSDKKRKTSQGPKGFGEKGKKREGPKDFKRKRR